MIFKEKRLLKNWDLDSLPTLQESDGTPQVKSVKKIIFPNNTLTDNGNNTVSVIFGAGTDNVTAAAALTDNALIRGNGGAKGIQDSGIIIDDSDNISGISSTGFDTGYTVTGSEPVGATYYDADNDTISTVLSGGVIGQHFQESFLTAQNDTGVTIANGTPVAYQGSIGNSGNFRMKLAQADASESPFLNVGILTESVGDTGQGKITTSGKVRGIQTNGANYGETWSAGDIVYISGSTAGYLTKTAPNAPTPTIPVALVLAAHASNGTLLVRPTFPTSMQNLTDVNGTVLTADGQFMVWDNGNGYFDADYNINDYSKSTDGTADYQTLRWNNTSKTWVSNSILNVNTSLSSVDIQGNLVLGTENVGSGKTIFLEGTTSALHRIMFKEGTDQKFAIEQNGATDSLKIRSASAAIGLDTDLITFLENGTITIGEENDNKNKYVYFGNGGKFAFGRNATERIESVQTSSVVRLFGYAKPTEFGTGDSSTFSLKTNNIEAVKIDTSQNVGIGTTPSYKFDVNGDVNTNESYILTRGTQAFTNAREEISSYSTGNIDAVARSDFKVYIDSNNNSTSTAKFKVLADGTSSEVFNVREDGVAYLKKSLTLDNSTLLASPMAGTIEYDGCSFYLTNISTQRAIDRTSDVAVATVTCENTIIETTLWTAPMIANSLCVGNLFKFHADGHIQNGGATAADEVTLRIKVGGVTIATLNPTTKAISVGSHWHIDANATQRTIGVTGSRTVHIDLDIDGITEEVIALTVINTTVDMTVTITAQWASADPDNIIKLLQGYMEYKN